MASNIFIELLPPWIETGIQPAFYDKESGTVLQQTARMYAKVNELIEAFNQTNDTVQDYIGKFNELHDYVYDYFDNLDVQEEINNKLDIMVKDGTFSRIVQPYMQEYYDQFNTQLNTYEDDVNSQIALITNRVNASTSGSPLVATSTSGMTDTTRVYVNTTNGKWYYYDGDSWEIGGTYQTAGIADENVTFNTLETKLQDFFGYEFKTENEELTWTENTFYDYNTGNRANTQYLNSTEVAVTAGEVYHLTTHSSTSVPGWIIKGASGVISYAELEHGAVTVDLVIPENATYLLINHIKSQTVPTLKSLKCLTLSSEYNSALSEMMNEKVDVAIKEHGDCVLVTNPTLQNTDAPNTGYFRALFFTITQDDMTIEEGDTMKITFDFLTQYGAELVGGIARESGLASRLFNATITRDDTNTYHYSCELTASSVVSPYRPWVGVVFTTSGTENYTAFNFKLTNVTKGTHTTLVDKLSSDANLFFPLVYSNIFENNKTILSQISGLITKDVYAAGDSLTAVRTQGSWVEYFKQIHPDCNVSNLAVGGSCSLELVSQLTNVDRQRNWFNITPNTSNYANCQAVFINIGTNLNPNGEGTYEASTPQISNATDLNDQPLNGMDVKLAVGGGFKYNGVTIDSAAKYWNLFANTDYGNLGLIIEYIQWKNPLTQIFLCPPNPCPNRPVNDQNGAWHIADFFKNLAKIYGVNYIDTISGMNINYNNSYNFSTDGIHPTAIRNQMYGNFVGQQAKNKMLFL